MIMSKALDHYIINLRKILTTLVYSCRQLYQENEQYRSFSVLNHEINISVDFIKTCLIRAWKRGGFQCRGIELGRYGVDIFCLFLFS